MKSQKKTDVFEIITEFQKNLLHKKPSIDEMSKEVSMMKYKVRPVIGDISVLDFKNPEFIEALWSLGKLDEFFHKQATNISEEELDLFQRLVDEMRFNFQDELNHANLKSGIQLKQTQTNFEIEIFKERAKKYN